MDLNQLGFSDRQKELFLSRISAPHGLILVTGPTGCGKTVTLYSALNYLNKIDKNIKANIALGGKNCGNTKIKYNLITVATIDTFYII